MHVYNSISGVPLSLLEMPGPHIVHPVNEIHLHSLEKKKYMLVFQDSMCEPLFKAASIFTLKAKCYSENTKGNLKTFLLKSWSCVNSHRSGPFDEVLQPCVAELQADDIVEFFSFGRRCFIVASPLGHWHLNSLLCVDIHDVYNASTAYKSIDRRFSKWFFFLGI